MDLETRWSLAGHPSHSVCVKVGVVTSCEVQLWVSIIFLICCVVCNLVFVRNVRGP